MAYVTHTATPSVRTGHGVFSFFAPLAERFAQYRLYVRTLNELSALNDATLADLGLSRSGLQRTALEAVYGPHV